MSYDVKTAPNGEVALTMLGADCFDLIVSDWKMAGSIDGVDLLAAFDERHPNVPVIVMTGEVDRDVARLAVPFACGFLDNPVDIEGFHAAANRCFARRSRIPSRGYHRESEGVLAFAPQECSVSIGNGQWVLLSAMKLRAFHRLWDRAGEFVSQLDIAATVQGYAVEHAERARPMCNRIAHALRAKIEPDPKYPRFIVTEWGKGVRLVVDPDEPTQ